MTTNALIIFEDDDLIRAAETNDNNRYLENKVNTVSTNLNAYLQSQVATITQNLNNQINTLQESVEDSLEEVNTKINSIRFIPDYTQGANINSGYVCAKDGIIIAEQLLGHEWNSTININGVQVVNATYTWREDYSGIIRPVMLIVGKGDVITFTNANVRFYPYKEV